MFIHHIDPVLLSLGPLEIRYYGLIYALGFVFAYLALRKAAKHKKLSLSEEDIDSLVVWLIIGVVLGARIFEILFYQSGYYFSHPSEIIAVWKGGLSFHGGLVGAAVTAYLFAKKKKLSFLRLADILVIPAALALVFGRIANFINAEVIGKPTSLPWAVQFPQDHLYRHPSQLYEALKNFLIFFILLKTKEHKEGYLLGLFLFLYGILRFLIEFVKEPEAMIGPLTMGQILGIPMIIVGVYLLYKKK
jgi:phosphatidylglycerol:prolipoprotein diacylglycerol transferase